MASEPPAAPRPLSPRRIFLVSFNKCGTGSFHFLFRKSGIASCHHGGSDAQDNIALHMFRNFSLARDPLTNIDQYSAYTDICYFSNEVILEAGRLYQYFHDYYPDSYFILATRDVDAWVMSRYAHAGGTIAPRFSAALGGVPDAELTTLWKQQFATHNAEVRAYFARHPGARFLEFDLDRDDPARIAAFLADDFPVDIAHWGQRNVTKEGARERMLRRMARNAG